MWVGKRSITRSGGVYWLGGVARLIIRQLPPFRGMPWAALRPDDRGDEARPGWACHLIPDPAAEGCTMRATDESPGDPGDVRAAQARDSTGNRQPGTKIVDLAGVRHARRAAEWGKAKYAGSSAEDLWHRLGVVDFMNQAMLLAATLLLCAVPFLLVMAALAGRSAVSGLTLRLGLSQQAAADVGHLLTSSTATSDAVTGLSWAFFILGGIAAAT